MPRRISFLTMSGAGPISSPVVRYSLLSRWVMLVFPQCLGQPVTHQMGRGRFQRMGHQPRIYLPEFNGHLVRLLVERYQPTLWPLQNSHYFEATLAYCFSDSFRCPFHGAPCLPGQTRMRRAICRHLLTFRPPIPSGYLLT